MRSISLRPVGVLLILVLLAGGLLAALGPASAQAPGAILACVAGLALLAGLSPGSDIRGGTKTLAQRRSEFGPERRRVDEQAQQAEQDEYMRRERERRERGGTDGR